MTQRPSAQSTKARKASTHFVCQELARGHELLCRWGVRRAVVREGRGAKARRGDSGPTWSDPAMLLEFGFPEDWG